MVNVVPTYSYFQQNYIVANGKGDLTTKKFHYVGDFNNNKLNGIGMIDFLNEGHHYEGSFQNNEIIISIMF